MWLLIGAFIFLAAVATALIIAFGNDQRNLCESVNQNREPLRLIIQDSKAQSGQREFPVTIVYQSGERIKATLMFPQSPQAAEFYERSIKRLQPVKC